MTRAQRIAIAAQYMLAGMVLLFAIASFAFGNVWFGVVDTTAVVVTIGFTYAQMPAASSQRGRYFYRAPYERQPRWHDEPREGFWPDEIGGAS